MHIHKRLLLPLMAVLLTSCSSDGLDLSPEFPSQEEPQKEERPTNNQDGDFPELTLDDVDIIQSDTELSPGSAEVELKFSKQQANTELPQRSEYGYSTHIIKQEDIRRYDENQLIIELSNSESLQIEEKDQLILIDNEDQNGLIFEVKENNNGVITLEKSTIQEALPDLDVQLEFSVEDITNNQPQSRFSPQAIELNTPSSLTRRQYSTEFIPGIKLDTLMDVRNNFNVKYDLKIRNGITQTFNMNFYSFVDTSSTLTIEREGSTELPQQKTFAPLFRKPFLIPAGAFSIPAVIEVTPVLTANINASQATNAQITGRAIVGGDLGLAYADSELTTINTLRTNFLGKEHGVNTNGSISAGVTLELKMSLTLLGKAVDNQQPGASRLSGPGGYISIGSGLIGDSNYQFNSNNIAASCDNSLDIVLTRAVGIEPGLAQQIFPDTLDQDYRYDFEPLKKNIWNNSCEVPETGNLSGIINTLDGEPVVNASLIVTNNDQNIAQGISNANGEFLLEELIAGEHQLMITAEGFESYQRQVVITENQIRRISRALVLTPEQQNQSANIIIRAVDAQDPTISIDEANITIYKGADTLTRDNYITSYSSSTSYISELALGQYTVLVSASGFAPVTRIIDVTTENDRSILIPISRNDSVVADGSVARIVLTWGETPRDLDSHLLTDYGHVYFRNKRINGVELDVDDTSSYGPETITIDPLSQQTPYRYYLHNYSAQGNFSDSQASVTLYYQGNIRTFYPPSGSGFYWQVFDVNNGIVEPCLANCLRSSAPSLGSIDGSARNVLVRKQ